MRHVYRHGQDLVDEIRETQVAEDCVALWNLGQEGYVLKGRRDILVVDPYLTNSIQESAGAAGSLFARDFPPPLEPSQLTYVDVVLCTHFHQDHLDPATLGPLAQASPNARFVAPASHAGMLREAGIGADRIVPAKHLEPIALGEFTVTPFAERHPVDEVDAAGHHYYLGYVFEGNGVRIYHSGDTLFFPELAEWLAPQRVDVAMIHINGRYWMRDGQDIVGNMNYREAVEFASLIRADLLVPMHYDLFESNRENPAYFVDYLFSKHREQKFHMFAVGERFVYHKSRRADS